MSIVVKSFEEVAADLRRQEGQMRRALTAGRRKGPVAAMFNPMADAIHDLSHTTSYAAESLADCVKRNPRSTLLFTAAIGFLVGWIVRDRQD
jgi:ElaB/YqjD/DUF883 family membrane-anchored ribosome-binding protein